MSVESTSPSQRKFSLVIHTENNSPNGSMNNHAYDISHPRAASDEFHERGRKPMTGSLMMLKPSNSTENASIKIRSMSCPLIVTSSTPSRRGSSDSSRRLSLREAYNSKYVENLKKDLMNFYNQDTSHLEEEVIEEEDPAAETGGQQAVQSQQEDDKDELDDRMLSSCISNRSTLTPTIEESENETSTEFDDCEDFNCHARKHSSMSSTSTTAGDSMTSIYSFNTDAKQCHRHHHRRPSCAIKFEEPKILEWQKSDAGNLDQIELMSNPSSNHHGEIFKQNYSLSSVQ